MCSSDLEPVRVPLEEAVPVPLAVLDGLPDSVCEALLVTDPDALVEPVRVPLEESDRLRSLRMLRPRKVSRSTTSAGESSLPSIAAASHSADSRIPLAIVLDGTSWVTLA